MSRASRRRDQFSRLQDNLPPERMETIFGLGVVTALTVVILNLVLAVTLSRAVVRGWRARHDGLASALRAGVNPWLIGLVGATIVSESLRALVLRALVRPALKRIESSPSPSS